MVNSVLICLLQTEKDGLKLTSLTRGVPASEKAVLSFYQSIDQSIGRLTPLPPVLLPNELLLKVGHSKIHLEVKVNLGYATNAVPGRALHHLTSAGSQSCC